MSALALVGASALGLYSACGGSDATGPGPVQPIPTTIQPASSQAQQGTVGTAVTSLPAVTVRDQTGNVMAGVTVTFAPVSGGGSLTGEVQATNGSGVATLGGWTLGTTVGENSVTAAASGIATTVTFVATAAAGPAAAMSVNGGNNQSAPAGAALLTLPSVLVQDSYDNPVSGVTVTFEVASGGGTITGPAAQTNASGIATVGGWTLGAAAGANTVTAAVSGVTGSPLTFTATGTATPVAIARSAGNNQTAAAGSAVAVAPAVKVTDAAGNPVGGVPVTFAVASGGGSLSGANQLTNAQGIASVGSWSVGTTPGSNTMTATSAGLSGSPITFTATAVAASASQMAAAAGSDQTASVGTNVAVAPAVKVTDPLGNPVSGVVVQFAVQSGGGSITGATPPSNAAGIATVGSWTLGPSAGSNTLSATVDGLLGSPVTFTANATIGQATTIAVAAGNGQTAAAGTAVSTPPSVKVTDALGNPVSGVNVVFAVQGGGGTVSGPNQATNALGIASVGGWTLGAVPGANTLHATAAGLTGSPVAFTATGATGAAGTLEIAAGNNQTVAVATAVPVKPSVKVTDSFGNPVSGVSVVFEVVGGGGVISGANQTTNAQGLATVTSWTLGSTPGSNTLTATSDGLIGSPAIFTATAVVGAASSIAINAGNNQTAAVGTAVGTAPSVIVKDAQGNPVSGVAVAFSVFGGGGSLQGPANQVTNAQGIATAGGWTLGMAPGANTLRATSAGLTGSPVTFTATAVAGNAGSIAVNAGNNQTVAVGSSVSILPSVKVTDSFGNPVGGVAVTFAVVGSGSITGANQTTNAQGIATVGSWTVGTVPGQNTLNATSTGLIGSPVVFTATVVAGAPALITIDSGNNQTVPVATAVPVRPSVRITDAHGNPVSGVTVNFEVGSGGGTVSGASQTTNAQGIATVGSWTVGPTPGANTLTATPPALGGSPVTFNATAVPGAAATITVNGGNAQTATVGSSVSVPPSVKVTDGQGNGVGGVTVTFQVMTGGGSITGATQMTNAAGIATVGSWTLGTSPGSNTLRATSGNLTGSPVTFTATATTGAATKLAINSGNNQTATVGSAVAVRPSVKVTDAFNNPVSGVSVQFQVQGGGGSVTGPTATTNAQGIATVGSWTLGTTPGSNTLRASSGGLTGSPATFSATAVTGPAAIITLNNGNSQTATVGSSVAIPPSVRVTDVFGNPVGNVAVTFAVNSGGGSVLGSQQMTNALGIAAVGGWTLGTTPGQNTLRATSGGLSGSPVTFTATGVIAAASNIALNAGNGQTAAVLTNVAISPSVKVTDGFGNPVPNIAVTFLSTVGGGGVNGLEQTTVSTNSQGIAAVTWRLGFTAGAQAITATAPGLTGSPVTFNATATAGPAAIIAINAGNNQTAQVGTAVAVPPSVKVTDQFGNPVSGRSVTFSVAAGNGSITGPTQTTNAQGIATVGSWTLSMTPGLMTLTASSGSISGSPVTITATAQTGTATNIARNAGNNQTAPTGSAVPIRPSVKVTDAHGNAVSGVTVIFSVATGGGAVSGPTQVTDAFGIATVSSWALGLAPGTNTLRATSNGLTGSPVTFTATGVQILTSVVPMTSTNQVATAGTAVAQPPTVRVRDQNNLAMQGVNVQFQVTAGGGTISHTSRTTGATGQAALTNWTLGSPGLNTVTATVTGLTPVTFNATALNPCGPPTNIEIGANVNGELTTSSCQLQTGEYAAFYSFTIATQTAVSITQTPSGFDSYLMLLKPNGDLVAENDDVESAPGTSEISAILAPGTYLIGATTFAPGETGTFNLTLEERLESAESCSEIFVSRAVTTAQTLSETDCPGDLFGVYLKNGETVTMQMNSAEVNAYLRVFFEQGFTLIVENDDKALGDPNAQVTLIAPAAGYYFIHATSSSGADLGNYTLIVN